MNPVLQVHRCDYLWHCCDWGALRIQKRHQLEDYELPRHAEVDGQRPWTMGYLYDLIEQECEPRGLTRGGWGIDWECGIVKVDWSETCNPDESPRREMWESKEKQRIEVVWRHVYAENDRWYPGNVVEEGEEWENIHVYYDDYSSTEVGKMK